MSRGERSNRRLRRHTRVPTDVRLTWESRDSEVLYLIRRRTMAGLEAAGACGRKGGRKLVMDEKKLALASAMLKNREIPVTEVCEAVGVSRSTLYRHLKPDGSAR
jgi:DNA-binding transcriptional ArsR family regulator